MSADGSVTGNSTSTNMSGLSTYPGLSSSRRTFRVREAASNWGSTLLTTAWNSFFCCGRVTFTFMPGLTYSASFRKRSARTQTLLRSAMRYHSAPLSKRWPGETFLAMIKPVAGATI